MGEGFPFSRGEPFKLGLLRQFEIDLLARRRADRRFHEWLFDPTGANRGWVKDRDDELVPLLKYAAHRKLPDEVVIEWRDKPDFDLIYTDGRQRLEVTTTAPSWIDGAQHGQLRLTERRLSNRGVSLIGHGFTGATAIQNDVVLGDIVVVGTADRTSACRRGLIGALNRKSSPSYPADDCTLLIYCDGFGLQTIDGEFPGIVRSAALETSRPDFCRVVAFHENPEAPDGIQEMSHLEWNSSRPDGGGSRVD